MTRFARAGKCAFERDFGEPESMEQSASPPKPPAALPRKPLRDIDSCDSGTGMVLGETLGFKNHNSRFYDEFWRTFSIAT